MSSVAAEAVHEQRSGFRARLDSLTSPSGLFIAAVLVKGVTLPLWEWPLLVVLIAAGAFRSRPWASSSARSRMATAPRA